MKMVITSNYQHSKFAVVTLERKKRIRRKNKHKKEKRKEKKETQEKKEEKKVDHSNTFRQEST